MAERKERRKKGRKGWKEKGQRKEGGKDGGPPGSSITLRKTLFAHFKPDQDRSI